MTSQTLAAATGLPSDIAFRWYPHIMEAAERFDFQAPARLAMWLAQCGHESGGFLRIIENLNYSADGLVKTWPSRFTAETAKAYARRPELIANRVYAGRIGNGDEASGDGWRYRGRGLIQITGRANYRECGQGIGMDLEAFPELLEQDRPAALSAGWYWHSRGLSPLADVGDIEAVTRKINGGLRGIDDRRARWSQAVAHLKASTIHDVPEPEVPPLTVRGGGGKIEAGAGGDRVREREPGSSHDVVV